MAKAIYVGATTEVPTYSTTTQTVNITNSNLSTYFTVSNTYGYGYGTSTFYLYGYEDDITYCYYTCKKAGSYTFNYTVSSEENFDKFSIILNNSTYLVNEISGEKSNSFTRSLSVGDKLYFKFTKDDSVDGGDDQCTWSISAKITTTTQTGTTTKEDIARKVKKMYFGVKTNIPLYTKVEYPIVNDLNKYFSISKGSYAFTWNDSINGYTASNSGVNSSTATLTLTALEDLSLSFKYNYGSETSYDKYTIILDGTYILNAISGVGAEATYTGNIMAGKTLTFTYSKDSSGHSNGDFAKFYDMKIGRQEITSTKTYDLARRVKKAYIGVGGKARPFWSEQDTVAYYGTVTGLTNSKNMMAAGTIGSYAVFAGGKYSSTYYSTTDRYNSSLTKSTGTNLYAKRGYLASAFTNKYLLFGGGYNGSTYYSRVEAYDTSMTRTTPTTLSFSAQQLAAVAINGYILFGGGKLSSGNNAVVNAYDSSLTRTIPDPLSTARYNFAAAATKNHALFGGGYGTAFYDSVESYNGSLTHSTAPNLTSTGSGQTAVSLGGAAIFAGGNNGDYHSNVDAYNSALTKLRLTNLHEPKRYLASTNLKDEYALIAGGYNGSYVFAVDIYNYSLVKETSLNMSLGRGYLSGASVGNYALFGGGSTNTSNSYTNTVDVYHII